jgi:hypothetical protein
MIALPTTLILTLEPVADSTGEVNSAELAGHNGYRAAGRMAFLDRDLTHTESMAKTHGPLVSQPRPYPLCVW